MNCDEIQSELQRQLDVELVVDDDQIREHCQTCIPCFQAWESARLLSDSIAIWREQIPEVDLVESVVAAHAQSISSRMASSVSSSGVGIVQRAERENALVGKPIVAKRLALPRRRHAIFAAAACLMALIAVALLTPSGQVPPSAEVVPVTALAVPPVESDVVPSGAARDEVALLNHAGAAYDTITKSAVGALEEFAWIVIPIHLTDPPSDFGDAPREHWINGLQDQLQPLQDGLGEALDFLREAGDRPRNTRT
jgi:hypothetical protein